MKLLCLRFVVGTSSHVALYVQVSNQIRTVHN
jgi:hypothetical protein